MDFWKKYGLLLGGLGFSNLGNWIYLVALNLFILNLTGSPGAVAGIYIVGPLARILVSFVSGSIIDRSHKQKLMVWTDVLRGAFILCLPFMESISLIYIILFIVSAAGSFFGPSSTFYITKYVSETDRKRFNALMGTCNSGAFLLGPALAGGIILFFNTTTAIWINSFTFFVCAFVISRLPKVEDTPAAKRSRVTFSMLKADFLAVGQFLNGARRFAQIYLLIQFTLMIAFALDSQEVTFIKQNLGVSDSTYGAILSIAGAGAIAGGIAAAALTAKISVNGYIGLGLLTTMVFYTMFYASHSVWLASASFILLGFCMAFLNTGYDTYYQTSVPPELMGRFGSAAAILQNGLQILFTAVLGWLAEIFPLQTVSVSFGFVSLLLSASLLFVLYSKKNRQKASVKNQVS